MATRNEGMARIEVSAKDIRELDAAIDRIVDRWFGEKKWFSQRAAEVARDGAAERANRARRTLEGCLRLGRRQRAWLREMNRNGRRWLYDPAVRGNAKGPHLSNGIPRLQTEQELRRFEGRKKTPGKDL